jgi:hypothetical protein
LLRETTNGLEPPLIAQKKLTVCCHEIPGPTSNSFDTSRRRWTGSQISFTSGIGSAMPELGGPCGINEMHLPRTRRNSAIHLKRIVALKEDGAVAFSARRQQAHYSRRQDTLTLIFHSPCRYLPENNKPVLALGQCQFVDSSWRGRRPSGRIRSTCFRRRSTNRRLRITKDVPVVRGDHSVRKAWSVARCCQQSSRDFLAAEATKAAYDRARRRYQAASQL